MKLLFPDQLLKTHAIGGKASALRDLTRAGFLIPEWFVVIVEKDDGLDDDALLDACARLSPEATFAVRSSAPGEDSTGHSFAGQFESHLFVAAADVPSRARDVLASGQSDRVAAYRREHNLPDAGPPRIIVQRMIDADEAGVAFSADPVSGLATLAVVSAVTGVGERLVSGEVDGETLHLDRAGRVLCRHSPDTEVLTDGEAAQIADLARRAEAHYGLPQDIEWALNDGVLYLLQSRPITTLRGPLRIWDNSNIAESYGGITLPLTESFAHRIYAGVYRQFCRILRVPEARVTGHDEVFEHMLRSVRGRVYYDLVNWYRVLAMLPGFKFNRAFMEQMMGVKEALPAHLTETIAAEASGGKTRDFLSLVASMFGLVRQLRGLEKQKRAFYDRLDLALVLPDPPLGKRTISQLADHYRDLEERLLTRWDAPLVNDFFAMIFFGVLRKLTCKWLGEAEDGALHNGLVAGGDDIISLEPARRIVAMAALARPHPDLIAALDADTFDPAPWPEFRESWEAYLEKFGDRCLEELKLESPTLRDDDRSLRSSVAALASRPLRASPPDTTRTDAEKQLAAIPLGPVKRRLFSFVLRQARDRIRDRENLRFERTRLFGRVRRIMVEIGKHLHAEGRLDDPGDIFYLELPEALASGDSAGAFRPIVAARKARYAEFEATPAPPDRIESRTSDPAALIFPDFNAAPSGATGEERRGIGCCAGLVRGLARVVLDPRGATIGPGEILVARQTDPGWVMLFPSAAGLLVERGSLLSHSAIVSRELGLPSVVGLTGLCEWLKTGDLVELNGATGEVRRLPS
jgi:phosphohistidine swiveling domain-containing protein